MVLDSGGVAGQHWGLTGTSENMQGHSSSISAQGATLPPPPLHPAKIPKKMTRTNNIKPKTLIILVLNMTNPQYRILLFSNYHSIFHVEQNPYHEA
jgi:hypothetical protein